MQYRCCVTVICSPESCKSQVVTDGLPLKEENLILPSCSTPSLPCLLASGLCSGTTTDRISTAPGVEAARTRASQSPLYPLKKSIQPYFMEGDKPNIEPVQRCSKQSIVNWNELRIRPSLSCPQLLPDFRAYNPDSRDSSYRSLTLPQANSTP